MRPSRVVPGSTPDNQPVDVNGLPFSFPYRSGETWFGNGEKIARWYYMIEILFETPAVLPAVITVPLNNAIQGFLLAAYYWTIEAYSAATLSGSPAVANGTAYAVLPQANFSGCFINLFDNNQKNFWQNKPLRDLQTINDTATLAGKTYADNIGGVLINWQNANIVIAQTANLTVSKTYSIPLGLAFSQFANWKEDGVGSDTYSTVTRNA